MAIGKVFPVDRRRARVPRFHLKAEDTGREVARLDLAIKQSVDQLEAIHQSLGEGEQGAILVAHGASWDVAFLEAEMARAERPMPLTHYIDTLNLSRRTFGLKKHSLDSLREHFGLDRSRAHRADADVAALRFVWEKCVAVLEPATPRDVWEVRIAERKARDRILVECTEAVAAGGPVTVFYRPRGRPQEPMRMVLTEIVAGLDPPRVIGYQLPGRGRRELRADRILRIEIDGTPRKVEP